jgi:SSS family solute:Na+ symporter
MLGLFLLGVFTRRAESTQAVAGMIVGILVIVWATFSRELTGPLANSLHGFMTTVLGTLSIFVVGVVLSRHRRRREKSDPPETVYDL